MGKIDGAARAKIIQSKCTDPASKNSCEGYVDQCISQKNRIGSDKGKYLLTTKAGKEISIKSFRTCTLLAPRIASIHGEPAGHTSGKKDPPRRTPTIPNEKEFTEHYIQKMRDSYAIKMIINFRDPSDAAWALMAREILFYSVGSTSYCSVRLTISREKHVGSGDDCKRLKQILQKVTTIVRKAAKARRHFIAQVQELGCKPSVGILFYYNKETCTDIKKMSALEKSLQIQLQPIANQIEAARKEVVALVNSNFRRSIF
jgi:hypothetical protein